MATTIEVKVDGTVWISVDLNFPLDKQAVEEVDKVINKIITDKNRDKIGRFLIDPRTVTKFNIYQFRDKPAR
jgi:hypothetical protein